jgi:hypothetical protein
MVYWVGIAPTLLILLPLLVYDWYYVEFAKGVMLSYFQYYSVYWFMTSTTCNIPKWSRPNIFSTTPFTGSRLVLRAVY